MQRKDPVIALDGPSGSGKSTVAKLVASELQLLYINTGAMFRAIGYVMQRLPIDYHQEKLSAEEEATIKKLLHDHKFSYGQTQGILVQVDNLNLTDRIRDHEISHIASLVSKYKVVRDFHTQWQREIVRDRPAVIDGRDIGTVIFPNAILKYFVTASVSERAQRRWDELKAAGNLEVTLASVKADIEERDHADMTREIAPLKQAQDAVLLDTTGKSVQDIVKSIVAQWHERMGAQ